MKWSDIPKLTSAGNWEVCYDIVGFVNHIKEEIEEGLVLNPDFQRGHVWTEEQQSRFIEYYLMNGDVGVIRLNAPYWPNVCNDGTYVCVDGLQRITALMKFANNEIKAFGHYFNEFEGRVPRQLNLRLNVNNLKTRKEVLKWYLELNGGGTPHSLEELNRVKELLEQENKDSY